MVPSNDFQKQFKFGVTASLMTSTDMSISSVTRLGDTFVENLATFVENLATFSLISGLTDHR